MDCFITSTTKHFATYYDVATRVCQVKVCKAKL